MTNKNNALKRTKTFIATSNEYLNLPRHLTAAQSNIMNMIKTKIPIDRCVDYVDFTMPEIYEMLRISKKDVGWLRAIFDKLKEIVIPVFEHDGTMIGSPVSDVKYFDDGNTVRFFLSNTAKAHFSNFRDKDKNLIRPYAKQLFYSSVFTSANVIVFWNIFSVIKNQQHKSISFTYQQLRERLSLNDGEYSNFFDFRKSVLEVMKSQISTRTGIKVNFHVQKQGKKIDFIRLFIVSIADYELPPDFSDGMARKPLNTQEEITTLMEKLKKEFPALTEDERMRLSNYYPAREIFKFIFDYKQKLNTKNQISDPAKVLMAAYYAFNKSRKNVKIKEEPAPPVQEAPVFIPTIKDFRVNNMAEQMVMKKILTSEFPVPAEIIPTLITQFKYERFAHLLQTLRNRKKEANQSPDHATEILRAFNNSIKQSVPKQAQ